jgi:hypothetical protein
MSATLFVIYIPVQVGDDISEASESVVNDEKSEVTDDEKSVGKTDLSGESDSPVESDSEKPKPSSEEGSQQDVSRKDSVTLIENRKDSITLNGTRKDSKGSLISKSEEEPLISSTSSPDSGSVSKFSVTKVEEPSVTDKSDISSNGKEEEAPGDGLEEVELITIAQVCQ